MLLFSGLFLLPFVRAAAWNLDEGIYLYGAQLTAQGAVPGRDFVELQGPGTFYWLALFFRVFGTSLPTARGLLLGAGAATAALTFHLSRRLEVPALFPVLFVIATSIPLGVMNSPHYDSNLFALLSFATFVYAWQRLDSGSRVLVRWALFSSGILAGLTTWFLQQKGFLVALSMAVALILLDRKRWRGWAGTLAAGYACAVSAELVFYAALGALPSLLYANLIWPLSTYETVNRTPYGFGLRESLWNGWYQALQPAFHSPLAFAAATFLAVPYLLMLALPMVLPLMALRRRPDAFRRDLIPYWFTGYALWASELHRWDLGHLRNGCVLLIVLFFVLCERLSSALFRRVALFATCCLVLSAAADVLGAASRSVQLHTRRGTLYALALDPPLTFLLSQTQPGDAVFVYPYAPIYYFLADVRNPTRWSNLMYGINTSAQFHEAIDQIDRKRVRYVLWDTVFSGAARNSAFPSYRPPAPGKLIMEPYLESHYHAIGRANTFRILERNR